MKVIPLPSRPVKPEQAECCGRHCENCVYVYYEKAMRRWRQRLMDAGLSADELKALEQG